MKNNLQKSQLFSLLLFSLSLTQSLSGVLISPSHSTASYCVMLNSHGELVCGVGDMDIHSTISPDWVRSGNYLTHHFLGKQTKTHYYRNSTHLQTQCNVVAVCVCISHALITSHGAIGN